jgi:endonuclease/exonuclease/phosphatase family metal-dependent hydrolase
MKVVVASLNTRGLPFFRSRIAQRYREIADAFESSTVDIVSVQEVLTYYHLSRLARHMPSYRHVSYRRTPVGPAGGLVTLSRVPVGTTRYHRLPAPGVPAGLRLRSQLSALLKGALVTRLAHADLSIVNTHPMANVDGDWSPGNRFHALQRAQLQLLARVVGAISGPTVVCGDFNVSRDSELHRAFMAQTGLVDAFDGRCPPTFRARYLRPGRPAYCIDFILTTSSVRVEEAGLLFVDHDVSDHIGLRATVVVG